MAAANPYPPLAASGRIVLIRLRSLGDTVLMTPSLEVVKRLPGWKVSVVVEEPFDRILEGNSHLDRVFKIPTTKQKWRARASLIRSLRAYKPDVAVDLHGGSTSALMTFLSGAPERVGYGESRNRRYYSRLVPSTAEVWGKKDVHTVEHQLAPLKHLGFPVDPVPDPHLPVDEKELGRIRNVLAQRGIRSPFLLVHPAAAFDTKQWESEKFASLLTRLAEGGQDVVVTAGPGQQSLLDRIRSMTVSRIHFLEPLSISSFVALASLCRLYVGNDTGPTHIAAALGKRIVVIWGSSDWRVWSPWKVEHRLLKSDLPCMPCPGYTCPLYDEPICIRSIEVDRVLEAVRSLS